MVGQNGLAIVVNVVGILNHLRLGAVCTSAWVVHPQSESFREAQPLFLSRTGNMDDKTSPANLARALRWSAELACKPNPSHFIRSSDY